MNPQRASPEGTAAPAVDLCAPREQDTDLQRWGVKCQMILLSGVYFSLSMVACQRDAI